MSKKIDFDKCIMLAKFCHHNSDSSVYLYVYTHAKIDKTLEFLFVKRMFASHSKFNDNIISFTNLNCAKQAFLIEAQQLLTQYFF
jgi:hypothetical protein